MFDVYVRGSRLKAWKKIRQRAGGYNKVDDRNGREHQSKNNGN
jgi:hypothetical protein